jgi:[NiFe] hydrogenase diaphorase moiety large subunit
MEFFTHESCGYCTPCRAGTVLLKNKLADFRAGRGSPEDFALMQQLGQTMKVTSRCGLGQTAANPVLTTMAAFRERYAKGFRPVAGDQFLPSFDIQAALAASRKLTGRDSLIYKA